MTRLTAQEITAGLIASREFHWCRARLLHALAGAFEQGVLGEVLEELMSEDDGANAADLIGARLNETGWLTDEQYGTGLEHASAPAVPNIFDEDP